MVKVENLEYMMQEIILNLQTPAWWFTAFFPVFILFLLGLFFKKIKDPVKKHLCHTFSKKGSIGRFFRKLRLKELQKIRKIRGDEVLFIQEIIKKYTYLILFTLSGFILFTLFIILSTTSREIAQLVKTDTTYYILLVLFITSPAYFFELLYLNQKEFVKKILEYRRLR